MEETKCQFSRYVVSWDWLERHENGLKLPIRDRIVGFRLRDMHSMVGAALTIERERDIEDTWNTRDTGVGSKRED